MKAVWRRLESVGFIGAMRPALLRQPVHALAAYKTSILPLIQLLLFT